MIWGVSLAASFFFENSKIHHTRFFLLAIMTRVFLLFNLSLSTTAAPIGGQTPLKFQVVCPQNGTTCTRVKTLSLPSRVRI